MNKGQIQEIARSTYDYNVFKSAKVSLESAAKMVIILYQEMVDDVLEDLKSGSNTKFNLDMDKLDKLVNKLGIDLKQYNKELVTFMIRREEKDNQIEEKMNTQKKKMLLEITKTGDIKILSNRRLGDRKE